MKQKKEIQHPHLEALFYLSCNWSVREPSPVLFLLVDLRIGTGRMASDLGRLSYLNLRNKSHRKSHGFCMNLFPVTDSTHSELTNERVQPSNIRFCCSGKGFLSNCYSWRDLFSTYHLGEIGESCLISEKLFSLFLKLKSVVDFSIPDEGNYIHPSATRPWG